MENTIQHIELINNYLRRTLTEKEFQNFENQLKTNPDLKSIYKEHLIFLEGLKRINLKQDIKKARKNYKMTKGLKLFGYSFIVVLIIVVAGILFLARQNEVIQENKNLEDNYLKDTITLNIKQAEIQAKETEVVIIENTVSVAGVKSEKSIIRTKPVEGKLNPTSIQTSKLQNKQVSGAEQEKEQAQKETIVVPEIETNIDNGFMFRDKKYTLENCDMANESSIELSKWEIDLYCCTSSFYDNPNNKSITTLLYLSIKSDDLNKLKKGKYIFTNKAITLRNSMTFSGSITIENDKMEIVGGEFTLDYDNNGMTIVFTFKVNEKEPISGKYTGRYNRILQPKPKM
ncbi:hypothetical protein MWU65_13015 [Cellulophaga sp. F20128]|uniref:hypothetical protein n=1 Tax=Cellulophaga sp. F20128 TaxID=2926413 RepID=UPI001FF487A2|nr:hypothetical protein [Cellulophaga sp. F20128]MCK0158108.1 hypothetical protein [Cellulophaga sp. F20128]